MVACAGLVFADAESRENGLAGPLTLGTSDNPVTRTEFKPIRFYSARKMLVSEFDDSHPQNQSQALFPLRQVHITEERQTSFGASTPLPHITQRPPKYDEQQAKE